MWANAQRDGRPAEYRWRLLFNAAKFGWCPLLVSCSNAAKTRNPLKFAGVPQTPERISAVRGPKFTLLTYLLTYMWGRYCCSTSFFPIVDTCLSCEDIAQQSCAMVPRWRIFGDFLGPAFSVSCVQHISDLHSKFKIALRPHHVWKYGRHPICGRWDKVRKRRKRKKETTGQKYNGRAAIITNALAKCCIGSLTLTCIVLIWLFLYVLRAECWLQLITT